MRLGRIASGSRSARSVWVVVGAVIVLAGCTTAAPPPASIVDVVGDALPLEDPPSRIAVVDGPDIREVTVAAAGGGIRVEIASSMEIDEILSSSDALDNGPSWYVRMWPPDERVTYMVAAYPDREPGVPPRAVGFHAVLCEDPVPSLHRWVADLYSCPNFVDLPQGAVSVDGDTVTIEVPGAFAPELGGGFTWIASTYWNTSPVFTYGFRDDAPDVPRLAVIRPEGSDTGAVGIMGPGPDGENSGVSHPPLEFRATFPGAEG